MSDFGTMVSIYRADGTSTTAADEVLIRRVAKELVYDQQNRVSEYADFDLRFGGSSTDGQDGIMVGLTEYMLGDDVGNDGFSDEAIIARDTPLAEQFARDLESRLGQEFLVEAYCGHW